SYLGVAQEKTKKLKTDNNAKVGCRLNQLSLQNEGKKLVNAGTEKQSGKMQLDSSSSAMSQFICSNQLVDIPTENG
ncbi:hypothetical protein KI387_023979, partial [Taxus chinensis]